MLQILKSLQTFKLKKLAIFVRTVKTAINLAALPVAIALDFEPHLMVICRGCWKEEDGSLVATDQLPALYRDGFKYFSVSCQQTRYIAGSCS